MMIHHVRVVRKTLHRREIQKETVSEEVPGTAQEDPPDKEPDVLPVREPEEQQEKVQGARQVKEREDHPEPVQQEHREKVQEDRPDREPDVLPEKPKEATQTDAPQKDPGNMIIRTK